jgi:hypothetical protein
MLHNDLITPRWRSGFESDQRVEQPMGGLTKRELFAAMAMQVVAGGKQIETGKVRALAESAIALADALIAELEKPHA